MLGTPAYISPEQAAGNSPRLTTAVDVYGLGAVLYELLCGEPPFAGATTLETLHQVVEREPRPLSQWNPSVDRDLETICLKCLEKQPSRRYGSAEMLALDLQRWKRFEPIQARPASLQERVGKWARRHPVVFAILATASLALAAIAAVSGIMGWRISATNRQLALQTEERRQQLVRLNVATANRMVEDGNAIRALHWAVEAIRLEVGRPEAERIHRLRFEIFGSSGARSQGLL